MSNITTFLPRTSTSAFIGSDGSSSDETLDGANTSQTKAASSQSQSRKRKFSSKWFDEQKHANTHRHKLNSRKIPKNFNVHLQKENITKDIMLADLQYTLLAVCHNFSFNSVKHIVSTSQFVFKDSSLSRKVQLSGTKCTSIVKNVLSPVICDDLKALLRDKPFSILLDESTDVSNKRVLLYILVRFISNEGDLTTELLDIVKISGHEGIAKGFFSLNRVFKNFELKFENIVGYCSDNASVMMGVKESFKSHLLNKNKNIVVSGCICHTAQLVASAASEVLPSNIESLLQNIYTYFSRSPKRQSILEELQEFFKKQKHKMLAPPNTRWLSLSKCVERVLSQWDELTELFKDACLEDKNPTSYVIYNEFQNPYVRAYLEFLKFILPLFNEFNCLFQSSKMLFPFIATEWKRFSRQLCGNFVKQEILLDNSLFCLNFENPNSLLPIEEVQFGISEQTTDLFKKMDQGDVNQFKLRCLSFYQKAAIDSVKRFPVKETWMDCLDFVEPKIILNYKFDENSRKTLKLVLHNFKHIANDNLAFSEIIKLPYYFSSEEKQKLKQKSVVAFWSELEKLKNFNETLIFQNISKIVKAILIIPHGNADVERVFLNMLDIDTKKNRMSTELLSDILRIKLNLKLNDNKDCCSTYINEKHFSRMSHIYKNSKEQE